MKGYKVFNPDWTCKGFKYAVGETFSHNGEIGICEAGFHFCTKITDCFNYYSFDCNNKVAEIEATGTIITDGDKSVTDVIKIVREISWYEVLDLSNEGRSCTGRHNTGNFNSGECNAGNYNSGDFNSCDFSNGFFNSVSPPVYAFNKPLNVSRTEFLSCSGVRILNRHFKNTKWVSVLDMTDDEKNT